MVLGIQILGILFGIFMIYQSFLHFKRKEFTAKAFGIWTGLWVVFVVFAVFPQIVDPIVYGLDFARTMDFYIVLGFMFLVGAVFFNYVLLRKNQKKLEEMVRKDAMERKK